MTDNQKNEWSRGGKKKTALRRGMRYLLYLRGIGLLRFPETGSRFYCHTQGHRLPQYLAKEHCHSLIRAVLAAVKTPLAKTNSSVNMRLYSTAEVLYSWVAVTMTSFNCFPSAPLKSCDFFKMRSRASLASSAFSRVTSIPSTSLSALTIFSRSTLIFMVSSQQWNHYRITIENMVLVVKA